MRIMHRPVARLMLLPLLPAGAGLAAVLMHLPAVAVGLLAQASPGAASPQAATPVAPPSSAAGSASARQGSRYPVRRAGLWEIQSSVSRANGLPPVRQCVGRHTDTASQHLDRSTGDRGYCTLSPFTRQGDVWLAQSVCRHSRNSVITRKVATGDFQTQYRIDTLVRTTRGKKSRLLVQDSLTARYLGPCRSGQRTGDLVAPGMGTLNMNDGRFQALPK